MSPDPFSSMSVARASWAYFADLDTGLLATLRTLCTSPGALVARQLAKPRDVFREPLRLFVFVNLVFFLIAPQVGLFQFSLEHLEGTADLYGQLTHSQQVDAGLSREVYAERFDNHLQFRQPTFAVLLVVVLATLNTLIDRRRAFGQHLMFALYAVSWILLSWPLLLLAVDTLVSPIGTQAAQVAGLSKLILLTLATTQWFVRAQRTGYGRAAPAALLQGLLLTASWVAVVAIYGQLLFWLTWALLPLDG